MRNVRAIQVCLLFTALAVVSGEALAQKIKYVLKPADVAGDTCNPHPQFQSFNIKKVAVLDFENSPQDKKEKFYPSQLGSNIQPYDIYVYLGPNEGSIVAGIFEQALVQSYKYTVIERRQIEKIMNELAFSQKGNISGEEASKLGNMLGVDAVIMGKVISAYSNFAVKTKGRGFLGTYLSVATVELRMVNVATGEIIWSCSLTRDSLNYLENILTVTTKDVLADPRIFNKPLHGQTTEERLIYILKQMAKESVDTITN